MKTIETVVYGFNELPSEKARNKARDWFRECSYYDNWQEATEEDAKRIGLKLVDFDVDSASFVRNVRLEVETSALQVAETIVTEHGGDCATYKHAVSYLSKLKVLGEACDALDGSPVREAWEAARKELDDIFIDALALDYKRMLQQELEYRASNEYIDENIMANEYTFTAEGKRFG